MNSVSSKKYLKYKKKYLSLKNDRPVLTGGNVYGKWISTEFNATNFGKNGIFFLYELMRWDEKLTKISNRGGSVTEFIKTLPLPQYVYNPQNPQVIDKILIGESEYNVADYPYIVYSDSHKKYFFVHPDKRMAVEMVKNYVNAVAKKTADGLLVDKMVETTLRIQQIHNQFTWDLK